MAIVVCPGIHPSQLTQCFLEATDITTLGQPVWVYPAEQSPPFLAALVRQFLNQHVSPIEDLILVAFSAGVVGAIGAAQHWHYQGRSVTALIALDGWGVPLSAPFPIFQVSHDRFTHLSSAWLGTSQLNFYADPSVAHLDLWRSPHRVAGWQVYQNPLSDGIRQRVTAAEFIQARISEVLYRIY